MGRCNQSMRVLLQKAPFSREGWAEKDRATPGAVKTIGALLVPRLSFHSSLVTPRVRAERRPGDTHTRKWCRLLPVFSPLVGSWSLIRVFYEVSSRCCSSVGRSFFPERTTNDPAMDWSNENGGLSVSSTRHAPFPAR